MTSDRLRQILLAQRFSPFLIHMADGRTLEVRHPELMAISPSGRLAFLFQKGDRHDSGHNIDILMITDVEVITGRSENGHRRRRKAG